MPAFFQLPLDLPHAGRLAFRISHRLARYHGLAGHAELLEHVEALLSLLRPFELADENPPEPAASEAKGRALELLRTIVAEIERLECGEDRVGQYVRNLFEVLEAGREGAMQSLRAGEDPDSVLRPV